MNQETKVIANRGILGRTVQIYGSFEEPLFLAQAVAEWIEHSDTSKMVSTLEAGTEKLIGTMFVSGQRRSVLMLTEDGLYEVLMLSRKPIAKQFKRQVKQILKELRIYGITATNQKIEELLSDPDNWIKALQTIKKEREEKEKALNQIEADQPKIIFANAVSGSENLILIREYAKILSDNGFVTGEKRLYKWFKENGFLNRRNEPYQEYVDMGLFKVIERSYGGPEGTFTRNTTKITGKGQTYFASKIKLQLAS